jgi:hypothetical protein
MDCFQDCTYDRRSRRKRNEEFSQNLFLKTTIFAFTVALLVTTAQGKLIGFETHMERKTERQND